MSRRIRHHTEHADRHPGGHDQIVAIAASECGISKNAAGPDDDHSKLACFTRQGVGTFSADDAPKINIKGGNYRWADTGDGYFTVYDVPLVSAWKKGKKGAPYDGDEKTLEEFVATAQTRYNDGHFCATAYKRHNPDIPITHPDFRGYVLPNRVGKYALESGEAPTIFGDIKLSAEGVAEALAGKLPYLSVEIPWAKRRIRGLSFQDTLPPEYEYALFTLGEKVEPSGKFEVSTESVGKFMDDAEDDDMSDKIAEAVAKYMGDHMGKHIDEYVSKAMKKHTSAAGKPDAAPAEPTGAGKMALDPEFAAKMTAQEGQIAELRQWRAEQENKARAEVLVAKAEKALDRKVTNADLMAQIAKFAADAVTREGGEQWFDDYVKSLGPVLRDRPPRDIGEFMGSTSPSADPQDPAVAKFAGEGPDVLEQVARFAAQYRTLKSHFGDRYTCPEEGYIKSELERWKDAHNGATRRT